MSRKVSKALSFAHFKKSDLLEGGAKNTIIIFWDYDDDLMEFRLCTLPSSEPRTSARSETWSGSALPKVPARPNMLKCYVFQHFYRSHGAGIRFFTKSLKRRARTAVARLVCVEMLASETQERRRSTFLKNVCFPPMRVSISSILCFAGVSLPQ